MKKFFKNKMRFLPVIILLYFLGINKSFAQCSGCTISANNSTSAYTIVSGQTLCCSISYTGSITLKGGVVCNTGTIVNMTFLQGIFLNYGIYNQPSSFSIANTATVNVHSFNGSKIIFDKPTFTPGKLFSMNIYKGASLTFNNVATENSGALYIEVGTSNPSGNPVITSTLNARSSFAAKSDFTLSLLQDATATFTGAVTLPGTGVKSITNNNVLTMLGDFSAISAGSATSAVNITNNRNMSINNFTANYTAGSVTFSNSSALTVTQTMVFSSSTNTLINTNNANITSSQNFSMQAGFAINTGTMIQNSMSITNGTVTNDNFLRNNNDVILTGTSAYLNNNSLININGDFNNQGNVFLGLKSIIKTNQYDNLGSGAKINGPSSVPDSLSYGKIIITGSSNNTGNITGKVMINDESIVSGATNIGYGFDAITTPALIQSSVLFGAIGASPGTGNPATVQCGIMKNIYGANAISISPSSTPPCGQPVNLNCQIQTTYYIYSWPTLAQATVTYVVGMSAPTFTWKPTASFTNPNLQAESATPVVNTTYTSSITFLGCVYVQTITVSPVISITSVLPATATKCTNSFLTLTATGGGGTAPYSYTWAPTTGLTPGNTPPNATQTVAVNSNTNYTVTVADTYGCAKTFTSGVSIIGTAITSGIPSTYNICSGDNVSWYPSPAGGGGGPYTYSWTPVTSTYSNLIIINVTSSFVEQLQITSSLGCVMIFPLTVNVSPPIILNSGPTTLYTNASVPISLGTTPMATGGFGTLSYLWTGGTFSPSSSTQNPFVTVSTSPTTYTVTVSDATVPPCTATQVFTVNLINSPSYGTFKKHVDAGYYQILNNTIYFTIDGEYNGTSNLNYKLYDINHTVLPVTFPTQTLKNGDNRYSLNVSTFGLVTGEYYSLELTNEKKEVFLLKVKK